MNKNQRRLYKALETITSANLFLEDAMGACDNLSKEQVQEVLKKFSETFTPYNSDELYDNGYQFNGNVNTVISEIESKLEVEPE